MSDVEILNRRVLIHYTNWRGETDWRMIQPKQLWFGSNEWHKQEQWLLDAVDIEKDAIRTFVVQDIHEWRPANE